MALIECPECGKPVSDKTEKCMHCGFPIYLEVAGKIPPVECPYCGTRNPGYRHICTNCGAQLPEAVNEQAQVIQHETTANPGKLKSRAVALLLCILFGPFGAHKFYEGKTTMGLVYLFTFGLFGIGWLVDIVLIAFKTKHYYI